MAAPTAPPSPAWLGQVVDSGQAGSMRGSAPSTAATAGRASSVAPTRMPGVPSPRPEPTRQAQAISARVGMALARPKPCSSRSETLAPSGPARLVAGREVAVFREGSCGL
jgi:hypothetical protein